MNDLKESLGQWLEQNPQARPVQQARAQARTVEQLQRQTVFRVMTMLRDANSMLNDIPPQGAEGAIRQAQKSIEAARLKLNSVTSKFQEGVQEQSLI